MNQQAVADYVNFYQRHAKRTERLDRQAFLVVAGVAVVLLGLVVGLKSPWFVAAWVAVVYGFTYFGTYRLRRALGVTKAALDHLTKFAAFLSEPRDRAGFQKFVEEHIDPDDDSNVPESVSALCTGHVSGENIRAASNRAFAIPTSELAVAQYRRTALILAGLFGTVLFFAIELGGGELLAGDLGALLPGLRGALASTLTGIVGSLTLGYIASSIDRTIEQAVWETEAFLGGPVANTLAVSASEKPIVNEIELWEALRKEVAHLRADTVDAYAKLAGDANTYGKSLEVVSQQIAQLPAVQVPPQLARLEDVVNQFAHSTAVLEKTASSLIEAVGTLGVFAPSKTLQQLDELTTMVKEDGDRSQRGLSALEGTLATTRSEISALHNDVGHGFSATRQAVHTIEETNHRLRSAVDTANSGVSTVAQSVAVVGDGVTRLTDRMIAIPESMSAISDAFTTLVERLDKSTRAPVVREPERGDSRTNDDVGFSYDPSRTPTSGEGRATGSSEQAVDLTIYNELHELRVNVESVPASLAHTNEQVNLTAKRVQSLDESVSDPDHGLRSAVERINSKVDQLAAHQRGVDDLVGRLAQMEKVLRWHERAARAPLMRLLLLPFRSSRDSEAGHVA